MDLLLLLAPQLLLLLWIGVKEISGKYLQGELKTSDNWAFLGRFCFLSEDGEFEYRIEFSEEMGIPNLLLYYDSDDQWPAVYKTTKTCAEKESVLKREQNQIINLTTRIPEYRDLAGCAVVNPGYTTRRPRYTLTIPTLPPRKPKTKPPESHTTTVRGSETIETTMLYEFSTTTAQSESVTDTSTVASSLLEDFTDVYDTEFDSENIFDNLLVNTTDYEEGATASTERYVRKRRSLVTKSAATTVTIPDRTVVCHNARRFRTARERWWFIAISNCNGNKGLHVKYRMLMTNGPPGDYWHEHFSADEFYILPVSMAFLVAYSFLMLAIILCSIELKSRQLLHSTYKLFVLSAFTQFMGLLLNTSAYLKYAVNGVGTPNAKLFGAMFMGCSETCYLLLLLLLAKGYTITRGRLSLGTSVKLTIFMCLYAITYITLFIYERKVFDPGEVLYLYESPAGYGLITLKIIAWLMFLYATLCTLKRYPEKSNFYYPFDICGTVWFIAGPTFILSANIYIDKWIRESVVCAVLLLITFGGHLMFLVLTMPSMANKNFPYHVRTTQIGVMEMTGAAGSSTIEHFSHHVYEPTNPVTEHSVIIPLTRRTEEIFGSLYTQHMHNFTRTAQHHRHDDQPPEITHTQNLALQNVLSWSLAKNVPEAELPQFEQRDQSSASSSRRNQNGNVVEERSRRESLAPPSGSSHREESPRSTYEYVKDVPLELFTISKMVAVPDRQCVETDSRQLNNGRT